MYSITSESARHPDILSLIAALDPLSERTLSR